MATHQGFNQETTATEVANAFSNEIRDKVVVIVGVSPQSLGESMALAFATHCPRLLVFASRTLSKMEEVAIKVKSIHSDTNIQLVEIDLSSFKSIRNGVQTINNIVDHIDILINNAAIVLSAHKFTEDGLEMQFGTNHIGPFLLTNLLMPKIINAAKITGANGTVRIVNVTSQGHVISPIRFSDPNFHKRSDEIPAEERPKIPIDLPPGETYVPFGAYGQCKTANILFALSLNKRLAHQGIKSIATHPGSIWTNLSRNLDEKHFSLIKNTSTFWKDLDQGSATTMVAALDPSLNDDLKAIYLSDCQVAQAADHASDEQAAEKLWQLSEDIIGQRFDFKL